MNEVTGCVYEMSDGNSVVMCGDGEVNCAADEYEGNECE